MTTPPRNWTLKRRIPSDPDICAKLMQSLVEALEEYGWAEREVFGIRMAMEETIVNAIRHGNQCSPDKSVDVEISVSDQDFNATITDQGNGFDPDAVPDPTHDDNLENCSGRGLVLIQNYADEVTYNKAGNSVTLKKVKP
jgi:serine/threonine-protein kinase RsbW